MTPMMTGSPAIFSHPAWMRAVLAQVPGADVLVDGASDSPFAYHAAQKQRFPIAHATSYVTALTPCPLPAAHTVPSEAQAGSYLNRLAIPLVLRGVPAEHPVTKAFLAAAPHVKILNCWERAGLNVSGSFENWLQGNFDHKRRKELKRLRARLSEQGNLVVDTLQPGADLSGHVQAFLMLEAAGWKGRRGTAIGNDARLVQGLQHGLAAMHGLGKVRFWTMRLDGAPVASLFALVDGGAATLGKIAHDEAYAKFSPGVLLIIEATAALFSDPIVGVADANAIPDHPMIDRIWRDRIACMDVVVAGATVSSLSFNLLAAFYAVKDKGRAALKRIYHQLTRRRSS